MKVALGLDGQDDPGAIERFVNEGADEFFAGFIPPEWSERFGWELNLNRRCFGPQYQYLDTRQLDDTIRAVHRLGKHIYIAFNTHQYAPAQLPFVRDAMRAADALDPDALIIADPAVLHLLPSWNIRRPIHLSTGTACYNSETVRHYCRNADVRRVIFPRKLTIREMAEIISEVRDLHLEFEAMVIGGRCPFNDELCFSWHTGANRNLCAAFTAGQSVLQRRFPADWKETFERVTAQAEAQFATGSELDQFRRSLVADGVDAGKKEDDTVKVGAGLLNMAIGCCGLCLIPRLRSIGVNSLKVITRGEGWKKSRCLKLVSAVVSHPDPTPEFCRGLLNNPDYCDGGENCYYDLRSRGT